MSSNPGHNSRFFKEQLRGDNIRMQWNHAIITLCNDKEDTSMCGIQKLKILD